MIKIRKINESRIKYPDRSYLNLIDNRFSSSVKEKYEKDINAVRYFISSKKWLVYYSDKKYSCAILEDFNNKELYFRSDLKEYPVPAGIWMGWYETHWKSRFGITEQEFKNLPYEEKAKLECIEQVEKWVEKEYEMLFLKFYFPAEHSEWWWNGGSDLAASGKGWTEIHPLFKELVR